MVTRFLNFHSDRCESFILVYVTMKNHNQGTTFTTRGYLSIDEGNYYTLQEPAGCGIMITDDALLHGAPEIIPEDEEGDIIRVFWRVKFNPYVARAAEVNIPLNPGAGKKLSLDQVTCIKCGEN